MKFCHLLLPATFALASCQVGPDFQLPDLSGGTKWKEGGATPATRLPDDWWRLFNDRELNRLVSRALEANNDLAAARARVNTSRALVGLDRARLFPTLDLAGSAGISRASAASLQGNLPPGANVDLESQNYRSTFDLAYDPDLWGRNKRQIEASSAAAAASEALLDSQRLGVAAEVARQYFLLRGLDAQESVLNDTVKSRQDALDIQKSKADAGLIDGLSSSRAKTEVELANSDLGSVQRQRGAAEHALAVLCGARPSDFSVSSRPPSGSLPDIRAGLPASVLNRRPDVRAAEQELRAANARIGVAEAAFYPNFSLTASGGFQAVDAKDFLNWENRILSLGAGVAAPLIDGGTNKSNYQAARSRYDEALATYRQTLLIALREVEDALIDLRGLAKSRSSLEAALASSRDTRTLSQERFDKGLTSYLDIVDADRTVLQTRLALSQIEAQQRITLAALAKALGGGWSGK
ncbi:efflux transporter outer membrane subunit [Luteolibacter yonseiensis]|uniref:Efflux transporter outer membrane subunit n=1 Tax=Luteolibacter yonseiensis TaxID=1144680 RepID=A0A934VE80_9BACT|nr:efflux transporter outer membrane subunit [Luteolibacter yonseiensis]MBK1818349.1 efflux transporter outer membrane subunit [Luteolibacter yonseiensis]